jgi:hypothetical protein
MSGIATAIAGAAIVGGISARNSTNKSIDASEAAGRKATQQLNQSTAKARDDLFELFPAAQQNAQQGYQGALGVFNQTLPQQSGVFQAGNVAAQNQLLAGMPQFQNAILGAPVDYSQFQATQLQQPDMNFANQQLQSIDPFAPQQPQYFGANRAPNSQQAPGNTSPNTNSAQQSSGPSSYNNLINKRY